MLDALDGWATALFPTAHANVLRPSGFNCPPLHLLHPVHATSVIQWVEFLEEDKTLYVAPLYMVGMVRPLFLYQLPVCIL